MSEVNTGTLKSRVIELVDDHAKLAQVLLKPDLISETKRYFTEVQKKDTKYEPFLSKDDRPPLDLQSGFDGAAPASDGTVLLRCSQARDVPGPTRRQVSRA